MAASRTILSSLTLSTFSLVLSSLVFQSSPVKAAEQCGETLCGDGFQCAVAIVGHCEACGTSPDEPQPESSTDPATGSTAPSAGSTSSGGEPDNSSAGEMGGGSSNGSVGEGQQDAMSSFPDEEPSCGGCFEEEYLYCERANCETDADCGQEMQCATFQDFSCPGAEARPDCEEGEDCPEFVELEPVECTSTEYSQCAYRQELPCEEALDCGDGYECIPQQSCSCTGSMAAAPPSMGDDSEDFESNESRPESEPVDCSCEPSGVGYCRVAEISCTADEECPDDWSCIQLPGACMGSSDGTVVECSEPESRCYPSGDNGPFPAPFPTSGGGSTGNPSSAEGQAPSVPQAQTDSATTPPGQNNGNSGSSENAGSSNSSGDDANASTPPSQDNSTDVDTTDDGGQPGPGDTGEQSNSDEDATNESGSPVDAQAEEPSANSGNGKHWGRRAWRHRTHHSKARRHSGSKKWSKHHNRKSKAHNKSHWRGGKKSSHRKSHGRRH